MQEAVALKSKNIKKMATKKSIDFSMQGEQKNEIAIPDVVLPIIPDVNITSSYNNNQVIFKLKNFKGKGNFNLAGMDEVINPKTKRREKIWYIPGEDSIWQSELTERLKDKEVRHARKSFVFIHKTLRIDKTDTLALDFLKHHNGNLDNPNRIQGKVSIQFEEHNPARIQAAALEKEMIEIEAIKKALEVPVDKMRKHALYLGVRPTDDLGFPKTDDGLRSEYMLAARRNPKLFNESLDSALVDISYMIKKAISENKINTTGISGSIVWAQTNAFICKRQGNKTPHECLLELATSSSDDGLRFKEQLNNLT